MSNIERGEGAEAMVCGINWNTTQGRMQGRARLYEAGEEIIALRQQLAGAVSLSDHERYILRQWGCAIRELDGERFSDEERALLDRLGGQ